MTGTKRGDHCSKHEGYEPECECCRAWTEAYEQTVRAERLMAKLTLLQIDGFVEHKPTCSTSGTCTCGLNEILGEDFSTSGSTSRTR